MSKLQELIKAGDISMGLKQMYRFTPEQLQAIIDEVYKITKAKARMCYSANRYKTQFEILNALSKIPPCKTGIKQ